MKELKFRVEDENHVWFGDVTDVNWQYPHVSVDVFTGIFDKNGEEIYTSDILEITGSETTITVNDLTEFLLYCGEYKGKNGIDLAPLLSVVERS